MKKSKTARGRMKLKVQNKMAPKVAEEMKKRSMSIMGDVSDDDEENDDYENYLAKKEEIESKQKDKAEQKANPAIKKSFKEKFSEKRI